MGESCVSTGWYQLQLGCVASVSHQVAALYKVQGLCGGKIDGKNSQKCAKISDTRFFLSLVFTQEITISIYLISTITTQVDRLL